MMTRLDDFDSDKGACSRYKEETTREDRLVSSFMTIFTQAKSAFGCYNATRKALTKLVHALLNESID